MIRGRRADSVRREARRWRGSKKNFSKKLKNFLSIFHPLWRISHLLYIERDTEPLRWQNFSKSENRFWRFDSPALRLTKTSWVKANDRRKIYFSKNVRFRLGFASSLSATVNESKKIGPRYLVDGVLVCASSDLCVSSLKVESPGWPNDDTTSDWLGSQSLSEWALGRWKKFFRLARSPSDKDLMSWKRMTVGTFSEKPRRPVSHRRVCVRKCSFLSWV